MQCARLKPGNGQPGVAMRAGCLRGLLGLAGFCLAGCAAAPPPRVDDTLVQLRSGRAALTCREACVDEWRRVQPQAAQLEAGGRAQELAALVLRVGYQDDLSLYYV